MITTTCYLLSVMRATRPNGRTSSNSLPEGLRPFFWDTDFARVSLNDNFGYIVRRLLSAGGPAVIEWLRDEVGDEAIHDEIVACRARGLSYPQVARWIPEAQYTQWIDADPNRAIWTPG